MLRVVVDKHGLGAADGQSYAGVAVEGYLEPPSGVLRVPRILQTVLVALDKELQVKSIGRERGAESGR